MNIKITEQIISIILVLSVVCAIIYFSYVLKKEGFSSELTKVQSTVDNRSYTVRNLPDKQQAANSLALIRLRLVKMIDYLSKKYPEDQGIRRLKENFRPDNISEGLPDGKYTSYSVNKGEKIVFCVRQRDTSNSLVDINTMMFVAIHEMAHLMSKTIGHTPEFWDNMKILLEKVIDSELNIYKYQSFHKKPEEYCGTQITDTPLKL